MSGGRSILDADMATLGQWALAGWRWWCDELADCVPPRWRARLGSGLGARAVQVPWDGTADLNGFPAGGALILPEDAALIRRIETPLMTPRDLDGMIALEARRLMPLSGEGAVLGARIVERRPETGRMVVDIAALGAPATARLRDALAQASVRPAAILALPSRDSIDDAVDLQPALARAGLIAGAGRATRIAWIIVAFLFALNLGVLVWRDSASVDALQAVVDEQRGATAIAGRVMARMRAQDRLVGELRAARATHEPLALMGRLAGTLPRGTWLRRLTLNGDSLRLTGMHPRGGDVAGALRRAGFVVVRYGDSGEAPTPLGEPFEATLTLAPHAPATSTGGHP